MSKMKANNMTFTSVAATTAAFTGNSLMHVSLEGIGVGQHVQLAPHPVVGSVGSSKPQTLTTLSTNPSSY